MRGKLIKFWDGKNKNSMIEDQEYICDSCNSVFEPFVGAFFEIPPGGIHTDNEEIFICSDCVERSFFCRKDLLNASMKYRKIVGEEKFIGELFDLAKLFLQNIFRNQRKAIPKQRREIILRKFGFKCVECQTDKNLEIDHIKPYSLGGTDEEENLQVLCKSCNRKKLNTWKK